MNEYRATEFDFLLPIGTSCIARYQVERILKNRNQNWDQPSCFFDWLMCGGVRGVTSIIENDFALHPQDFSVKTMDKPGNHVPLHLPSGFRFLHDLGCSAETRASEEKALDAMKESMEGFIEKYRYLGKRTHDILRNSDSVGLVFYGRIPAQEASKLLSLLEAKYDKRFTLINLMRLGNEHPTGLPNVISIAVDNAKVAGTANEWKGDDGSWDEAFATIKTLEPQTKKPRRNTTTA